MIVYSHIVDALIDSGYTLSYVTMYVAMKFRIEPEQFHAPFFVSTPISDSIMAIWVYKDYNVTLPGRITTADLVELANIDFDVIMEIDCLYLCYAKIY